MIFFYFLHIYRYYYNFINCFNCINHFIVSGFQMLVFYLTCVKGELKVLFIVTLNSKNVISY